MRIARHRRTTITGINMTPMIDIVFLLIIFFMTVSWIAQAQEMNMNLPVVDRGGKPFEPVRITINLDAAGQLYVNGAQVSMDELVGGIRQELDQVGQDPTRLLLLLRCDRSCPGRHVNELIRQLELLEIRQVRVSVVAEQF
jgi:biopolymer transport protein ExbD